MIDYDDDDDHMCEKEVRARIAHVIAAMDELVLPLPLIAALRPYTNFYSPDMAYPAVVLTDLFADRPGEGAGSIYMDALTAACEKADLTLYTDAQNDRSRDFYLARGFEVTTGRRDHQLVRWPPEEPDHDMEFAP